MAVQGDSVGEGTMGGEANMSNKLFVEIVVTAVFIAGLLGLALAFEAYKCRAVWADSGLGVQFKIVGGCMLQRSNGTWIPARSYREMGD